VAAEQQPARLSVSEWQALERDGDVKHEYSDGLLQAMAGGSLAHMRIASNLDRALNATFGDGPCVAYTLDAAVRVSATQYTYPDVVVTCAESDQPAPERSAVTEPRVIVEVLSPSTEQRDRGPKWDAYRRCASLREYVLVGTEYQRVEVYRRTEQGWGLFSIYGPEETVQLTSVSIGITVSALYQRSGVPLGAVESPSPRP
jgi:Uma2 family endonuclease